MKLERMMTILTLLLNREKVTAKSLAERFEVSVRTIQRDMDALSAAGFPVYANRGKEGGYHLHDDYKMDKRMLTDQELSDLNAILQGFSAGFSAERYQALSEKFSGIGKHRQSASTVKAAGVVIDLSDWGGNRKKQEKLQRVQGAIESKHLLVFRYANMKGEWSARVIEPVTLYLKGNTWYIYGWCRKRQDYRLFRLSRMSELKQMEETFDQEHSIPSDFISAESWVVERPPTPVGIRFKRCILARLGDWFDLDHLEDAPDGRLQMTISWPVDEWFYTFLLSFGTDLEVIEPPEVRAELQHRAEALWDMYRDES